MLKSELVGKLKVLAKRTARIYKEKKAFEEISFSLQSPGIVFVSFHPATPQAVFKALLLNTKQEPNLSALGSEYLL